jgi:acylpyruvate hydrolase
MGGDEPPKEPVIFTKPHSALFPCFEDKEYIYKLPKLGHEIHHEIEVDIKSHSLS